MKPQSQRELDAYLKASESWANDRNRELERSRRTAWWVAIAACAIAGLEAIAIVVLTPLKTVQPYTLLVDRQTGYVEALKPLERQMVTADAALTRSFVVQYVIAREGFTIDTLQTDYRKVALWSAGEARQQYIEGMQASNPASPLVRYPRSTVVNVVVKSVTSLSPSSALVRFNVERIDRGRVAQSAAWVALLRFTYSGEAMTAADRLVNPLGFKVTRYRKSEETLPEPVADTRVDTTTGIPSVRLIAPPGSSSPPYPSIPQAGVPRQAPAPRR